MKRGSGIGRVEYYSSVGGSAIPAMSSGQSSTVAPNSCKFWSQIAIWFIMSPCRSHWFNQKCVCTRTWSGFNN